MWGSHDAKTHYKYDPEAAKVLLAAAAADGHFDPTKTYKLYAPTTPRPPKNSTRPPDPGF